MTTRSDTTGRRWPARRPRWLAPSAVRAPFWQSTLLRLSAAFLVISLVTGFGLVLAERTLYGSFAIVESLHVALGWAALPVYVVYTVAHVWSRWATAPPNQWASGTAALVVAVVVLASGVDLALAWVLPVSVGHATHLWAAVATCAALAVHTGPAAARRIRRALVPRAGL